MRVFLSGAEDYPHKAPIYSGARLEKVANDFNAITTRIDIATSI